MENYRYWSRIKEWVGQRLVRPTSVSAPVLSSNGDEWYSAEDGDELLKFYGKPGSCKVIRRESLLAAQKEELARVMELLSINESRARTLLMHYYWDVDKVIAVLAKKGEEKLYAEASIPIANLSSSHLTTEVKCEICFEVFPPDETTTVDCGHCFCNDCWTEYFTVKINEGHSRRIACMAHKCNMICDEGKIRSLVSLRDRKLAAKFDRFLLESYIEDNKRVKWCPSVPHCGNAIRIEKDGCCEVECVCGQQFCFNCLSEAHSPCSCSMWELWRRKCSHELPNVNWIATNTKFCPKCRKPVQKIGGCNLVTCICGQPFCWLCGGATGFSHTRERIYNHKCSQHKEERGGTDEEAWWRYMHYYSRYKAHTKSLTAEANLNEKLHHKIESSDHSWVRNAFHGRARSRQILSYSYPFAYYMFGNELFPGDMSKEERAIKQKLFESLQQRLERNIERLSRCLERLIAEYDKGRLGMTMMKIIIRLTTTKTKIITLATITDDLCKRLYDCIENELLGSLQSGAPVITPYRSEGVEKVSDLPDTYFTKSALLE